MSNGCHWWFAVLMCKGLVIFESCCSFVIEFFKVWFANFLSSLRVAGIRKFLLTESSFKDSKQRATASLVHQRGNTEMDPRSQILWMVQKSGDHVEVGSWPHCLHPRVFWNPNGGCWGFFYQQHIWSISQVDGFHGWFPLYTYHQFAINDLKIIPRCVSCSSWIFYVSVVSPLLPNFFYGEVELNC